MVNPKSPAQLLPPGPLLVHSTLHDGYVIHTLLLSFAWFPKSESISLRRESTCSTPCRVVGVVAYDDKLADLARAFAKYSFKDMPLRWR